MTKLFYIFCIYLLSVVISNVYSFDLNISTKDLYYRVQMNMNIIVKKNKVIVAWDHTDENPRPESFTLSILTNSTVDKETGEIYCGGSYVIADNITDYQYKWKVIKLQKYDMYSFLVTANGYKKYGLSKPVYYAPNLYKFIRLGKHNSTLRVPYIREDYIEYGTDDDNVVNNHFNETFRAFYKSDTSPSSSNTTATGDENPTEQNNERQVPVEKLDGVDVNKVLVDNKKAKVPMNMLISTVAVVIFLAMTISIFVLVHQKHERFVKGGDSIILEKDKSNTSYSEGYTQDFENRSEAAISVVDSVIVRERLKREALAIERRKVLESLSEKKLASGSSNYITTSSNYVTTKSNSNSEVFSNPTTDFSWQGMEVMAFTSIKVPESQRKPIQHKPYNQETSFNIKDIDYIDGIEADITQNPANLYSNNNNNNNEGYCSSLNDKILYSLSLGDNVEYNPSLKDNSFYNPVSNNNIHSPSLDDKKDNPNSSTVIHIKE